MAAVGVAVGAAVAAAMMMAAARVAVMMMGAAVARAKTLRTKAALARPERSSASAGKRPTQPERRVGPPSALRLKQAPQRLPTWVRRLARDPEEPHRPGYVQAAGGHAESEHRRRQRSQRAMRQPHSLSDSTLLASARLDVEKRLIGRTDVSKEATSCSRATSNRPTRCSASSRGTRRRVPARARAHRTAYLALSGRGEHSPGSALRNDLRIDWAVSTDVLATQAA